MTADLQPVPSSAEPARRPARTRVAGTGEPAETSVLRDHLRVLRRRRWTIVQAIALAGLAAAFLSLRQPPLYRATANVFLAGHSVAAGLDAPDANLGASERARLAQTDADLARAPEILRATARRVRAGSLTVGELLRHSSVSPRATADVLDFHVTDASPRRAQALATEYARQFVRYRQGVEAAAIETARRRLDTRIDDLRAAHAPATTIAALRARSRDLLAERDARRARSASHQTRRFGCADAAENRAQRRVRRRTSG